LEAICMTCRTLAAAAALLSITTTGAQAQDKPRPDEHPPWKALTSSSAALKVVFDEICLPAILDGQPVASLAVQRHLIEVKPKLAGFSGDVRTWRLASLAHVYVAAWADGTCSATVDRGDPEAFRRQVLDAVAARDIALAPGISQPAKAEGINTAYCSAPPQPLVISIITPADKKSRRPAIFVNAFRARGAEPSFCKGSSNSDPQKAN
jgi:hypothetical protein